MLNPAALSTSSTDQPNGDLRNDQEKAAGSLDMGMRRSAVASLIQGYADIVVNRPQPLPEVDIPFREPHFNEGEMFFMFSQYEIIKSTKPFQYAVVLKFPCRRPSLDHLRGFIKNRWGRRSMLVVGQLKNS